MKNTSDRDLIIESKSKTYKIIEIARKMIESKIDLIEGCREIADLQYKAEGFEDAFWQLKIVASDTDYIPLGRVRYTCTPEYLIRVDREKEQYLALARDDILNACKQILEILS
jgi:hypothetical protein